MPSQKKADMYAERLNGKTIWQTFGSVKKRSHMLQAYNIPNYRPVFYVLTIKTANTANHLK